MALEVGAELARLVRDALALGHGVPGGDLGQVPRPGGFTEAPPATRGGASRIGAAELAHWERRTGHAPAARGILAGVSIGGTLAEARQAAGLTVADVSAATRIRVPLIRAIEEDDFAPCGGDFYARGHIRAIARAVGVDSRPLIAEYDAARHENPQGTLEDLFLPPPAGREPAPSEHPRHARGPARARGQRLPWLPRPVALLALIALAVIGGGAYQLAAGSGPQPAGAGTRATLRNGSSAPAATPSITTAPASPAPASSAPATVTVRQVKPSSVTAVGPGGAGDGDNPGNAGQALSGDAGSPWRSQWYTTAAFGNLKSGTGLLLALSRPVTAAGVTIRLDGSGASLQIRAGTSPGSLRTVASVPSAGSTVRVALHSRPRVRYLVLWFTRLPPDGQGTYQAAVYGVTVSALQRS